MSVHDGGRSQPGNTQPRSRTVIARRMATGHRLVWRPTSRTSLVGAEHDAVGAGVAGRFRRGRSAGRGARRPRRGSGRAPTRRRAPGAWSASARSTRTPARSADTARPADAGVAVVGQPAAPVDAGAERGFDQVGVVRRRTGPVDPQPALERARDVQAAHLVGLVGLGSGRGCRCRRPRRASGGWRAGSPRRSTARPAATRSLRARRPGRGGGGRSRRWRAGAPSTAAPLGPPRRRRAAVPAPRPAAGDSRSPARADPVRSAVHAAADSAPSAAQPPSCSNRSNKAADSACTAFSNCSVWRTAAASC